jgi:hypothetical protein
MSPTRPKRVRALVKQHDVVYEKWHIKRWFDENRKLQMAVLAKREF